MFCFDKDLTLVSYKANENKIVTLLSTIHVQPVINKDKKPEIVEFYYETKGSVDTLDQMCHHLSCNSKIWRWPLAIFMTS